MSDTARDGELALAWIRSLMDDNGDCYFDLGRTTVLDGYVATTDEQLAMLERIEAEVRGDQGDQ